MAAMRFCKTCFARLRRSIKKPSSLPLLRKKNGYKMIS